MLNDRTIKKIFLVTFSNVIKLISSVAIGFVLPNILGITDFAYYKIFLLYLTYTGLFHFGFIDGVYLKYGGTDFNSLDKEKFRMYFSFIFKLELLISLIGIILVLFFIRGEKQYIFTLLFVNLIAVNLLTFYQFISQITLRFKEYSIRIILLSFTNIIAVAVMYFLELSDYKIYVFLLVLMNYGLLLWYVFTYKSITFGKKDKIKNNFFEIYSIFKLGIVLLLANLSVTFVINIDKQIVEYFFPVESFGIYSFAYSMLSIITVIVSAVGVVLYPILKKSYATNISNNYHILNKTIILVVIIGLIGYFPLIALIPIYLPDYVSSIIIFRIALPSLIMSSSITAVKLNFYKITNTVFSFFKASLIIIFLNITFNILAYYIFGTMTAISISSVVGMGLWYIITEYQMIKKYHVKWKENISYILLSLIGFYTLTEISNWLLSATLYVILVLILVVYNIRFFKNTFLNKGN